MPSSSWTMNFAIEGNELFMASYRLKPSCESYFHPEKSFAQNSVGFSERRVLLSAPEIPIGDKFVSRRADEFPMFPPHQVIADLVNPKFLIILVTELALLVANDHSNHFRPLAMMQLCPSMAHFSPSLDEFKFYLRSLIFNRLL